MKTYLGWFPYCYSWQLFVSNWNIVLLQVSLLWMNLGTISYIKNHSYHQVQRHLSFKTTNFELNNVPHWLGCKGDLGNEINLKNVGLKLWNGMKAIIVTLFFNQLQHLNLAAVPLKSTCLHSQDRHNDINFTSTATKPLIKKCHSSFVSLTSKTDMHNNNIIIAEDSKASHLAVILCQGFLIRSDLFTSVMEVVLCALEHFHAFIDW